MEPTRHLVVAHYNESLDWLNEMHEAHPNVEIFVYTKARIEMMPLSTSLPPTVRIIKLPNVGRESHTYLHHIIENFDALADFTVFTQANPFDHRTRHQMLQTFMTSTEDFFPPLSHNRVPPEWKFVTGSIKNSGTTIGGWWKKMFNTPYPTDTLYTAWNGIFSVHKSRIISKPKSFYETLISSISHHFNPEEGHFFERTWGNIFAS